MSKESELITLLSQRTKAGTQSWEATAVDDEFVTVVADFSAFVRTAPSRDRDDPSPDVLFEVRDKEDRVILSIRNGDSDIGVGFPQLRALHEDARRSALKIDRALDAILKSLK